MKISEAIEQLQKLQQEHGDLEIWGMGDYELYAELIEIRFDEADDYHPPRLYLLCDEIIRHGI